MQFMLALLVLAQLQPKKVFPANCPVCNETKKMAWGGADTLSRQLRSYQLPVIPDGLKSKIPREAWVFEITVNLDGALCELQRVSGGDPTFGAALSDAIHHWKFSPLQSRIGPVCYQTRLYFYVRNRDGKVIIEVPGLTTDLTPQKPQGR